MLANYKQRLHNYHILNSVVPVYFQTKFPYNIVDYNKVKIANTSIDIIVKELNTTVKGGDDIDDVPYYGGAAARSGGTVTFYE